MESPICQQDTIALYLGNRILQDVDDIDILSIELFIIACVADWSAGVQLFRGQFPSLLWIPDGLCNLPFEEVTGHIVGSLIRDQVTE